MHVAAHNGCYKIIQELVALSKLRYEGPGTEWLQRRRPDFYIRDKTGYNVMFAAAKGDQFEIVQHLHKFAGMSLSGVDAGS